jgi:uncharacterized delta-60 repeat protein
LLIRLTKDGVLDTGFNDTGYTQVRYPNEQNRSTLIGSFMVTPKREVVVCGQIELEGSPIMGMLARYGSDGRPDTTFGTEGTGFIALGVDQQRLRVDDLVADDNGGFVGIGTMAQQSSETQDAIIFGRMVNGEPDPNFNNGEITGIDLQVNSEWYSAARVPVDNTIVATGITFDKNFENQGIIVGRYLKSGPLDVNFGDGNGWKILDPGQEPRLLLQDDKILVCYVSRVASERGCVAIRLLN